jgi:hypothetical protein
MSIPTSGNHVRLKEIHPAMKERLSAFFADKRIKGKVIVSSGCRTYASQSDLYRRYRAGTFPNVVANPDRRHGPGLKFKGSFHMEQPDAPAGLKGYAFAVDFRIVGKISTTEVNKIAAEYGLKKTVPSEWWHHQAYGNIGGGKYGWYPAPALKGKESAKLKKADPPTTTTPPASSKIPTVKKGSRGAHVKLCQKLLAAKGYRLSRNPKVSNGVDGIAGGYTQRAIRQFQKDQKGKAGPVDGICGGKTWARLQK